MGRRQKMGCEKVTVYLDEVSSDAISKFTPQIIKSLGETDKKIG